MKWNNRIRFFIYLFACCIAVRAAGQTRPANNGAGMAVLADTDQINMLIGSSAPDCADAKQLLSNAAQAKQLAIKAMWYKGVINANKKSAYINFSCFRNYIKAVGYFQENAALAQKNNNITDEALALEYIAKCYENMGQHKQAIASFEKALDLNPGTELETGLLGDMGYTYNSIGDYTNALSAYVKSLQILERASRKKKKNDIEDTLQRASLLINIGDIYLAMSQPDKALENYTVALDISKQVKERSILVYPLIGLGTTYKAKKNYEKAISLYNEALYYSDSATGQGDQAIVLVNLANVYLETGQPALAMEKAAKALQLAETNGYTDILPKCYAAVGKVYLARGNYAAAVSFIEKALNTYHNKGELDDEKDAWQAISTAYEKMGQPAKSLNAFHHYIAIRDSIYNIQKANELTRIDLEFRYSRKQLSDSMKQAGIFEKTIQRQRFITYSSYTGLFMVLLLMFFIYRNYATQKKYNLLLSKERKGHLEHIEEQSNVLTDIAHTQSHNVRGPLATILGLVQLFNQDDPADPVNKVVIDGVSIKAEELDKVIKEVVNKENKLRKKQKI